MLNQKLLIAGMMAATMAELFPAPRGRGTAGTPARDMPTNEDMVAWNRKRGDDATAIAAAQEKRARKNAKRAAQKVGAGDTAIKRPNAKSEGADGGIIAGGSLSTDGLCGVPPKQTFADGMTAEDDWMFLESMREQYCECGTEPDEEEQASGRCKCCGKGL